MSTLKGPYFINNLANGQINVDTTSDAVVSSPEAAVVCGYITFPRHITGLPLLQWLIMPVADPGPWPKYYIAPAPCSIQAQTVNQVNDSLFVVTGAQPDVWFIFPLKPQLPNVYAYVSWHTVSTRLTTLCLTRIFRRPKLEAHYWLLKSSDPGTQVGTYRASHTWYSHQFKVSVVREDAGKFIADYGVNIPENCRWEITPVIPD
jgi:hypothetical protein